jgi:hypothetical protein
MQNKKISFFPTFEMELVSNPTINLDTVSGKVTTVGELANGMKDILERQEIILDKDSVLRNMLKSLE